MKTIKRNATYTVKGMPITFEETIKIDEISGEEIYDPNLEQENDIKLYNEYRRLNELLYPEEIKKIREKFGVTQIVFAQVLGLGDKTITRYENGSLQDTAPNNLIKIVGKNPKIFLELLSSCKKLKTELSEENFKKLFENVSKNIKNF